MTTMPVRFAALLALMAMLVMACGGGDEATDDAEGAAESPSAEATATPAPDPTAAPEPTATTEPTPEPEPTATATPEPERTTRMTIDDLLAVETPLNIAHAGGDQDWPHSTPYAFEQAALAGVDMLEIDVQLTGDGVLIVHHDETVDRTTEATGAVLDRTLAEIQALDSAYWFSPTCWPCQDLAVDEYIYRGVRSGDLDPPAGFVADDFGVVTFADLVERFPSYAFDIEMKGSGDQALAVADALAAEIVRLEIEASVVVVSFDDAAVSRFEELLPDVDTSPGVGELTAWLLGGVPLTGHRIVQVPPEFQGQEVINDDFWAAVAEAQVVAWVWPSDAGTQENEAFYREMIDAGADGVIAGRPATMELVSTS